MSRFRLLVLVSLALSSASFAQDAEPVTLTLDAALEAAPEVDADVLDAHSDLDAAERDLARTRADPQALGLDLLAAEQAVAAARDRLETATAAAELGAATAYAGLIEAEDALAQAEVEREIAATTLEATRARQAAGAATELEAAQAANDLAAAVRTLQEAQADSDLALSTLRNLLGRSLDELAPITDAEVPDAEPLDVVLAHAVERNTRLRTAERAVESARAQLAATDNAFSAQAEIDAARDTLTSAQATLETTRGNVELSLRQAYASVTAARNRLQGAVEAFGASLENLEGQRARLEAGSISALAFREVELSHLVSGASLASSRHSLLLALLQLEAAVLE
jgi:outer membrane protein, heavy metal efflux system